MCVVYSATNIFIPSVVCSGGGPAAHGFAGTSEYASIPSVVSSGGDPTAHGFAGTSDHIYWTARDPGRRDLTCPQNKGLANYSKFQRVYIYIYVCCIK